MKKQPPKQPRGRRWPKDHVPHVKKLVSLLPKDDAIAIQIGDGNRSRGIQIALRKFKAG